MTGSTTEPVISHSTSIVSEHEESGGERQAVGDGLLLVDELRGRAGHERVGAEVRGEGAYVGRRPRWASVTGRVAGDREVDLPDAVAEVDGLGGCR